MRKGRSSGKGHADPRAGEAAVYQLRITLRDVSPPVWRRLVLPGDRDLEFLARAINACFRWSGAHLHRFTFSSCCFGQPDPRGAGGEEADERGVALSAQAAREGESFVYLYDFGDDWTHDVLVEEIRGPGIAGERGPACPAGERAGPPEDCGGPGGYEHILRVLSDPGHPERAEMARWLGRPFDPEAVDLAAINRKLRRLTWRGSGRQAPAGA